MSSRQASGELRGYRGAERCERRKGAVRERYCEESAGGARQSRYRSESTLLYWIIERYDSIAGKVIAIRTCRPQSHAGPASSQVAQSCSDWCITCAPAAHDDQTTAQQRQRGDQGSGVNFGRLERRRHVFAFALLYPPIVKVATSHPSVVVVRDCGSGCAEQHNCNKNTSRLHESSPQASAHEFGSNDQKISDRLGRSPCVSTHSANRRVSPHFRRLVRMAEESDPRMYGSAQCRRATVRSTGRHE